ncbi:hypothetical protein [Myxococcus faecalis]|uniref:hypothetical protein n=1 Tax=Myxococcus faecalis TaxID=3115646 RepID=UPI003CF12862
MSLGEWRAALRTMRDLLARDPTDKESLKEWQKEAMALLLRLDTIPESNDMEEIAWHFLDDADIRVKDEGYARVQREGFESWLKDAERALPPE